MKHQSLLAFLDGDLAPLQFRDEIASEVFECTANLKSTGNGRVIITEGRDTVLTRARTRRLVKAVADRVLWSEAASYVADCIIMSHTFDWEDDLVGEVIHFLAEGDFSPLREDDVRRYLNGLESSS